MRKLRTVIWDYAGDEISERLLSDVEQLAGDLEAAGPAHGALAELLTEQELEILRQRAIRALSRASPAQSPPKPPRSPLAAGLTPTDE